MRPRRLTAVSLWNVLDGDEREVAALAYIGPEEKGRGELEKIVAEARHFQPATVRKWTDDKIGAAMRTAPLHDPMIARRLLQCYHVPGQLPMVTAFLDALGVPHEEGRGGGRTGERADPAAFDKSAGCWRSRAAVQGRESGAEAA